MKRVRSLIVQLYRDNNNDLVHNLEYYTYDVLLPLASNKTLKCEEEVSVILWTAKHVLAMM